MISLLTLTRCAAAAALVTTLAMSAGCTKTPEGTTSTSPAATVSNVSATAKASPLGDLSAFRTIAGDMASMVTQGNLPAAVTRAKDLEVAWDAAEAGLKPRAASDWHKLDKAIDHALTTLRANSPNPASSQQAMADLLKTFDTLEGKS